MQIDRAELARQSAELGAELMKLEQQAYAAADQPFNLNSPKQLQEILFDKMGIPTKGLKKPPKAAFPPTKPCSNSSRPTTPCLKSSCKTAAWRSSNPPTPTNYRNDFPKDGRVHTTYAQAVAITGRLASNNPNLQNIPIRTAEAAACAAPLPHRKAASSFPPTIPKSSCALWRTSPATKP